MANLLSNKSINLVNTNKFKIERNLFNNGIELHFKMVQNTQYNPYPTLNDSDEYIFGYANKLTQIENKSVLIVGLGLGLMASYLQDKCPLVHVVEIEQELIDIISSNGYLNGNVTIFQGDIFTFNTDNKYDLIVNDIYWDVNDQFETNNQYLINKFINWLNPNGYIYTPIIGQYKKNN